jgi:hypothetical protein
MKFLLDTNVISEWVKPIPNAGVMAWLDETDEDRTFLSVATLAEIRYGIERLAHSRRRTRLDAWLRDEVALRFEGRVLPIDSAIAEAWGPIVARREAAGRPIGLMDAFIAATATTHGLTVVTRDLGAFEAAVPAIFTPWSA